MKRKVLLLFLAILLILTLIGCEVIQPDGDFDEFVPPVYPDMTEEDVLKELVNYYWYAISQGWYRLAKHCCIPDGDAYNVVGEYEAILYPLSSTLEFVICYNKIEIMENDATVNIDLTIINTSGYGDSHLVEEETLYNYIMYLVKPKTWKLK